MNMHWEQAAREALALVPLDGTSEEIRAKVEAVLAAPLGAYVGAVPDGWRDKIATLLTHIEDVVSDETWERIDAATWNAVSAMLAAPQPKRAAAEVPVDEQAALSAGVAEMSVKPTPREVADYLYRVSGLPCNCDLDRWQPEASTRHSWVCRIHKAAMAPSAETLAAIAQQAAKERKV